MAPVQPSKRSSYGRYDLFIYITNSTINVKKMNGLRPKSWKTCEKDLLVFAAECN